MPVYLKDMDDVAKMWSKMLGDPHISDSFMELSQQITDAFGRNLDD